MGRVERKRHSVVVKDHITKAACYAVELVACEEELVFQSVPVSCLSQLHVYMCVHVFVKPIIAKVLYASSEDLRVMQCQCVGYM